MCASMMPGITVRPRRSTTRASRDGMRPPTAWNCPPRIATDSTMELRASIADAAVGEDQIQGSGRDRCLREGARVGRDGQRPEPGHRQKRRAIGHSVSST